MKNLSAILFLGFVSITASAQPAPPYLVYTTIQESIDKCVISSDGFVRTRAGTRKISWVGIRNATVLQSLILEASQGMVVVTKHVLPPYGRFSTFTTFIQGKEQRPLKTTVGGVLAAINTSEAAGRLIKFAEVNCRLENY